jgi:hypothetical protein
MSREVGEAAVENVLAHFGVKGQKWGVRRKATVGPQEVVVSDKRIGKGIKTSGGKGHPATKEAIGAREIGQIGKKSGLHTLSDQQLQQYAKRIQLEQNVARLQYTQKSRGARFVDGLLGRQGSQLANAAAKEAGTKAGRSALNAATRKSLRAAKIAATVAAA